MQAAAHRGAGDLGAMADLGDGQLALALLEGVDDRQAAGQGGHEVRVAGEGFDALGRRGDDGRRGQWQQARGVSGAVIVHLAGPRQAFDRLSSEGAIIAIAFLLVPTDAQGLPGAC